MGLPDPAEWLASFVDVVDYEIELENLTGRDLGNLLVFTNQEGSNSLGGMGKLLGQVQLSTF